jgi:hypothetical protein
MVSGATNGAEIMQAESSWPARRRGKTILSAKLNIRAEPAPVECLTLLEADTPDTLKISRQFAFHYTLARATRVPT